MARCGALLAVTGLLGLIAPASAEASVQIVGDQLSAQTELVNAQTWAEVAGNITFSNSLQGDTVVLITGSPRRPCAQQPPTGVQSDPGPGADAESVPVLADGDDEIFILTPSRREVSGQTTRLRLPATARRRGSARVEPPSGFARQPSQPATTRAVQIA